MMVNVWRWCQQYFIWKRLVEYYAFCLNYIQVMCAAINVCSYKDANAQVSSCLFYVCGSNGCLQLLWMIEWWVLWYWLVICGNCWLKHHNKSRVLMCFLIVVLMFSLIITSVGMWPLTFWRWYWVTKPVAAVLLKNSFMFDMIVVARRVSTDLMELE